MILNRAIQAIKKKNEAILRYLSAHSLRSLEMSFVLQSYSFLALVSISKLCTYLTDGIPTATTNEKLLSKHKWNIINIVSISS